MFLFHAVHRICTPCVNKFLDVEGFSYSGKKKKSFAKIRFISIYFQWVERGNEF